MPIRRVVAAGLAVLAGLAAACGATPDSVSDAEKNAGSVLRVAFAEPVGTLDPHGFSGHFLALDLVYEPLVRYGEGGELRPGLATAWDTSPDGRTFTFHLRTDVLFHDGTDFDAAAVKWNFDRWVGHPDFGFLRAASVIEKVEVGDPHTVILRLSEPYAPLVQELTIGRPVRFLSPASASADGTFTEPIGTGPWRFSSAHETRGSFVRNDSYWGDQPQFEELQVKVIPDSQTRLSALKSGEVDLIGGAYMAPINAVEAADLAKRDDITLLRGAPDTTLVLGFNPDGYGTEPAVREAVSLVVDVGSINTVLYGDDAELAERLFPETVAFAGERHTHELDPERAAQLLDQAGWVRQGNERNRNGERLTLVLLLISDAAHGQHDSRITGQVIAEALEEVGVEVAIHVLDGPAYFEALSQGRYDLAFFTTYGAPYDPSGSVTAFLTGGSGEAPLWSSPELDQLVHSALSAPDAELGPAYSEIFSHLHSRHLFIPITHPPRYYAVGPAVAGFGVPPTEYDLGWPGVTINR